MLALIHQAPYPLAGDVEHIQRDLAGPRQRVLDRCGGIKRIREVAPEEVAGGQQSAGAELPNSLDDSLATSQQSVGELELDVVRRALHPERQLRQQTLAAYGRTRRDPVGNRKLARALGKHREERGFSALAPEQMARSLVGLLKLHGLRIEVEDESKSIQIYDGSSPYSDRDQLVMGACTAHDLQADDRGSVYAGSDRSRLARQ